MIIRLLSLMLLAAIAAPSAAYAGWGAITSDIEDSGACGVSYGWRTA